MQLVRALLNPTRIRILDAVAEGPASVRQLVATLDESLGVVSYHVGVLRETGCLRPTVSESEQAEGVERRYELSPLATPTWRLAQKRASPSVVNHPPAAILRTIVDRGADDLGVEPLTGRSGDHLGCFSVVLDRRGWREVSAAIGNALDRVSIAHAESARRLAETDEEGISATVAVASFEAREGG